MKLTEWMPTRRGAIETLLCAVYAANMWRPSHAVAQSVPRRGGTLRFGLDGEPGTYDAHASLTFSVIQTVAPHYSTLLTYDLARGSEIVGDLAENWSVSSDNLAYEFILRKGITFHDGTPFSAADVKATYERLRNPPNGVVSLRRSLFESIASIEAAASNRIVFRLSVPDPSMRHVFASPWNSIYSARQLASDPASPARVVNGTGPFRFVEHVRGSSWRGTRFEQYFRPERPWLDGFQAFFFSNSTNVATALQGRQIDAFFRSFTPAERNRLVEALGARVVPQEANFNNLATVAFNVAKSPYNDPRVRRALSLAIDRRAFAANLQSSSNLNVFGGLVTPGSAFAASDDELSALPGFGRNIEAAREEARRLLRDAGVRNLRVSFLNRTGGGPVQVAAVVLGESWRRIGVELDNRAVETSVWTNQVDSGQFDAAYYGMTETVDDPTFFLINYISKSRSGLSLSGISAPDLDKLFDEQRLESNIEKRRQIIRRFEAAALESAHVVPLLWVKRYIANSIVLRGWNMSSSAFLGQSLSEVWLDR